MLNEAGALVSGVSLRRIASYLGQWPAMPDLAAAEAYVRRVCAPFGLHSDAQWRALTEAVVVMREGKVYFQKDCPTCGPSEAMVSEDADYYVNAYAYARSGTRPFEFSAKVEAGCPTDCGVCDDHEQHTCLPIIEVTDHCNLECPICIVNNQYSTHISNEAFTRIIDGLVRKEGYLDSIALSGGEPSSHPRILELLASRMLLR